MTGLSRMVRVRERQLLRRDIRPEERQDIEHERRVLLEAVEIIREGRPVESQAADPEVVTLKAEIDRLQRKVGELLNQNAKVFNVPRTKPLPAGPRQEPLPGPLARLSVLKERERRIITAFFKLSARVADLPWQLVISATGVGQHTDARNVAFGLLKAWGCNKELKLALIIPTENPSGLNPYSGLGIKSRKPHEWEACNSILKLATGHNAGWFTNSDLEALEKEVGDAK